MPQQHRAPCAADAAPGRLRRLTVAALFGACLLLGAPVAAPAQAPGAGQPNAREVVTRLHQRWVQAVERENLGELANLYLQDESLRQITARLALRVEGWEAVRRSFDRLFAATTTLQLDVFHRDVVIMGATGLVSAYIAVTAAVGQETQRYLLRQTQVYHQLAQGWRMVHEHLSEASD
ncbi:MAG: DUF3225 domain-containing protein [Candidatus Tectomicrobia bacterium]|nr:DUF3225 domain-containing protein [Candidatus Tectomicrobia bacterium]